MQNIEDKVDRMHLGVTKMELKLDEVYSSLKEISDTLKQLKTETTTQINIPFNENK